MKTKNKFGKNLKRILKEHKITQEDFAKQTKLTQGFISKVANGKVDPSLERVITILKCLNKFVSVDFEGMVK